MNNKEIVLQHHLNLAPFSHRTYQSALLLRKSAKPHEYFLGFISVILVLSLQIGCVCSVALVPDFLRYETCVDNPPNFSPGCMSNVTVDLGKRADFNCQVDPRCIIQYINWYHEDSDGIRTQIKTGRSSVEPYMHTIERVYDRHLGKYICEIANIMGKTECSAYLEKRNSGAGRAAAPLFRRGTSGVTYSSQATSMFLFLMTHFYLATLVLITL